MLPAHDQLRVYTLPFELQLPVGVFAMPLVSCCPSLISPLAHLNFGVPSGILVLSLAPCGPPRGPFWLL